MSETDIPTSGGFWATVGSLGTVALGGLGVAAKAWFNRKKAAAGAKKTEAETDLAQAKAEATAVGTATDLLAKVYEDNDRVRADYERARAENSKILLRINECETDREQLRTLVEKQAREIGKHSSAMATQTEAMSRVVTRVDKLEGQLRALGHDPLLAS